MKTLTVALAAICFLLAGTALADQVSVSWEPVSGATGYKLQISTDNGTTWTDLVDAGPETSLRVEVPSTGLVLIRAVSYNDRHTAIRYEYGAWYCGDWKPIDEPSGLGIE
jgi:hypothetical protein